MPVKKNTVKRTTNNRHFIAVVIIAMAVFLAVALKAKFAARPQILPASPLVASGDKPGWKMFVYPDGRFNFLYPDTWNIQLKKPTSDDTYDLTLIYQVDEKSYAIRFMRGGKGAPQYDSVVRETRAYGEKTGYKNIYIQGNQPVDELITFRDTDFIKPYIGIEAELPPGKGNEYSAKIDEFVSTLQQAK